MQELDLDKAISRARSVEMEAYDALPFPLRRELVLSPYPIPAVLLARAHARGGMPAALHRLRDQERVHAHLHERVMAEACLP